MQSVSTAAYRQLLDDTDNKRQGQPRLVQSGIAPLGQPPFGTAAAGIGLFLLLRRPSGLAGDPLQAFILKKRRLDAAVFQ